MDQKELIDRLRRDPNAVQSLMTSADGQRLMQLLSGGDGGRTLQQAAGEAAAGNTLVSHARASPKPFISNLVR